MSAVAPRLCPRRLFCYARSRLLIRESSIILREIPSLTDLHMKRISALIWRLSTLITAAMVTYAWAQEPAKPPAVRSQFQKVEVTVEAIHPATREVVLRGPNGPYSVAVGPEVQNLDKLHVGDKVIVSYYQGLAAQMAKGDTRATDPAASTFKYRAPGGQPPGGGAGGSITTTVRIEAIDRTTNTVAFRRSDGSVHIIAVQSPNMVEFIRTLKPGDSVDVTYTESVAINVVPAAR